MIVKRSVLAAVLLLLVSCGRASDSPVSKLPPTSVSQIGDTAVPEIQPSAVIQENTEAPASPTAELIPTETPAGRGPVRGIILFIGDGMGVNQRLGGQWLAYGQEGQSAMDMMPVHGMASTSAADRVITDSAAAATALAAGVKTNYRAVGLDADYNRVPSILEQAKVQGWSVGLVTTVPLAHATPAGFAAHVDDRSKMNEIARQMIEAGVDVMLGGGEDDFLPKDRQGCHPNYGHQDEGVNPLAAALDNGWFLVCTQAELTGLDVTTTDKVIGFFGDDEIIPPFSPSLAEMTRVAIEILSRNPQGFFLMVEGGQIDWAGHDNDGLQIMKNTIGLDVAVTEAQLFAVREPNTLIIVTADHETGGMTLNLDGNGTFRQDGPFTMPDGTQFWVDWEGSGHTPADVQVTAQGPYSELFSGSYQNTFIYQVMYLAMMGE